MKVTISGVYWKKDKTFPSLNDYIHALGTNPRAGGKMKADYDMIACDAVRLDLKRWKPKGRITLAYSFYEPNKGKMRDQMNVFSFFDKVFQDALVKCKVIDDDSPHFVDGSKIAHEFFYTNGVPKVEIEITEVDN